MLLVVSKKSRKMHVIPTNWRLFLYLKMSTWRWQTFRCNRSYLGIIFYILNWEICFGYLEFENVECIFRNWQRNKKWQTGGNGIMPIICYIINKIPRSVFWARIPLRMPKWKTHMHSTYIQTNKWQEQVAEHHESSS